MSLSLLLYMSAIHNQTIDKYTQTAACCWLNALCWVSVNVVAPSTNLLHSSKAQKGGRCSEENYSFFFKLDSTQLSQTTWIGLSCQAGSYHQTIQIVYQQLNQPQNKTNNAYFDCWSSGHKHLSILLCLHYLHTFATCSHSLDALLWSHLFLRLLLNLYVFSLAN